MEKINQLGQLAGFKPVKRIPQLVINKPYKIFKIYKVMTKSFGLKLVCDLGGFTVFLPERFSNLTDVELQELNDTPNIALVYQGQKPMNSGRNPATLIEVKVLTPGTAEFTTAQTAAEDLLQNENKQTGAVAVAGPSNMPSTSNNVSFIIYNIFINCFHYSFILHYIIAFIFSVKK